MLLTDYFRSAPDLTWDIALQCGVRHGTIRLPEDDEFDVTSLTHLRAVTERFQSHGITPLIVEPLPNELHDHIKSGDEKRDECIDKFITLMKNLHEVGITTVCFNFMAHYGWTRTAHDLPERGGAKVTGFSLNDFQPDDFTLTHEQMWDNFTYFVKAAVPYAEKYNIQLALHPDDPPLPTLGGVARIFTSLDAIQQGIHTVESPNLGVTFCQACYRLMGERLEDAIPALADKIFFIHFRNVCGNKTCFRETFHDNGEIDMAAAMRLYLENGVDVPIRVDHVPTLAGEAIGNAGYDVLGRLFAIGYMKGIIEAAEGGR
ncbi:MAG: mannonate dehydratase [Clostridia bacterium]|nr:mannonate dehydratase [Clostridia bacterium]